MGLWDSVAWLASVFGVLWVLWQRKKLQRTAREERILRYRFPAKVSQAVREQYPHLTQSQANRVIDGLRDYFIICYTAGKKKSVSMPSQAVDVAWHQFILFTRNYAVFCDKAFGRFLHHTPAEAMTSQQQAQEGIKLAWQLCCKREGIKPRSPEKLPLLFALDAELQIPDGMVYALNCEGRRNDYCASHIGCSGCGSGSCSSCSGCGGGCGGD